METLRAARDPPLLGGRGVPARSARCTSRRSPNQRLYTLRRPLGVVGLITPWNFPIAIPVWKLAPALIYGNTRRAEARLRGAAHRAPRRRVLRRGRPARRACSTCSPGAGSKVGAEIVSNPGVRAISFTGSVPVGALGARRGDGARLPRPARARRPQPADRRRPTPSSTARSRPPTPARSGRPARSARRRGASSSRTRVYDAFREKLLARVARRQGRRPGRSRDRGRPGRQRRRDGGDPRRDRARASARAARCSPAASAPTTTATSSRRPSSRGSPTTPSSRARRSSAR